VQQQQEEISKYEAYITQKKKKKYRDIEKYYKGKP
jgi:hypothetical protein